jgi:hypothetical protein
MQWVSGAVSLEIKWEGHEAESSPPPMVEAKNGEVYLHSSFVFMPWLIIN